MIENRIREIRTSHGLSQEALATIIDSTQQSISRMENNTQAITAKALIMMSEYFNVSTGYLLGISDQYCYFQKKHKDKVYVCYTDLLCMDAGGGSVCNGNDGSRSAKRYPFRCRQCHLQALHASAFRPDQPLYESQKQS